MVLSPIWGWFYTHDQVVGGDDLQQGPRGIDCLSAAVAACAWRALVVVPEGRYIGLPRVVLDDGSGRVLPLGSAGGLLVPVGCQQHDAGWCPSFARRSGLLSRCATVIGGFVFPWAGPWVLLAKSPVRLVDILGCLDFASHVRGAGAEVGRPWRVGEEWRVD